MNSSSRRRHAFVALAGAAFAAVTVAASPSAAARPATPGVAVLPFAIEAPKPLPDSVSYALDDALRLVEAHPADLAYAWVDRTTNAVVIDAVTPAGATLAAAFTSPRGRGVPTSVHRSTYGFAALRQLMNDVVDHRADLPDGALVTASDLDPEHNRVVVVTRGVTERLRQALVQRYGARAVAVRIEPWTAPHPLSRDRDFSPYYGGARIVVNADCSSGFSWYNAKYIMLTAGHCRPSGGNVYAGSNLPENYMGDVWSGYRESYDAGVGTVFMTGQTTYHGDIAYINMESATNKSSAGRIYRGGPTSTTSAPVKGWLGRRLGTADGNFCTGGATTGELCGWNVYAPLRTQTYTNGETVRPVVVGVKSAPCTAGGDSGGPVYKLRSDGGVTAFGLISGGGYSSGTCWLYFTDMYDADAGFPGSLLLG